MQPHFSSREGEDTHKDSYDASTARHVSWVKVR